MNYQFYDSSRFTGRLAVCLITAAVTATIADPAWARVFDWRYKLGDPVHPGTVPVPELGHMSGPALAELLAAQDAPTVKVVKPLDTSTVDAFLDGPTPLQNIFASFENPMTGGEALTAIQIEALVTQTAGTASSAATIGQFALDAYHPDATNPNPASGLSDTVYDFSDVNAGLPDLFPGFGTFRSPAAATSLAPNILSSLFTLPLTRLAAAIDATPPGDSVIPFVSRFNSFGSPLVNSEFEGLPAYETTDQLLSRGDYQALISHYRLRGADGVIAHNGGLVEYDHATFLDDTKAGWNFLDEIYPGDTTPITLSTSSFEAGGFARSGAVGDVASGKRVATFLLTNLSNDDFFIDLPSSIEGDPVEPYSSEHRFLDSKTHRLLTFWLDGGTWKLLGSGEIYDFPPDEMFSRGGIGIGAPLNNPEPSTFALLTISGLIITSRRRASA